MTKLIDYAMPCMKAERALKQVHDAILAKKYDEALEAALDAIVEARMTYNSVLHMKEQHDALREQTAPVQEGVSAASVSRRARAANGASAG